MLDMAQKKSRLIDEMLEEGDSQKRESSTSQLRTLLSFVLQDAGVSEKDVSKGTSFSLPPETSESQELEESADLLCHPPPPLSIE